MSSTSPASYVIEKETFAQGAFRSEYRATLLCNAKKNFVIKKYLDTTLENLKTMGEKSCQNISADEKNFCKQLIFHKSKGQKIEIDLLLRYNKVSFGRLQHVD